MLTVLHLIDFAEFITALLHKDSQASLKSPKDTMVQKFSSILKSSRDKNRDREASDFNESIQKWRKIKRNYIKNTGGEHKNKIKRKASAEQVCAKTKH
jgi:hypothetical protein